jgi:hypothetical protein
VFNTLTGLLPTEAVLSIQLIKSKPKIFVNEETRMLEHFRQPDALTQWTLMIVDVVHPGWVPFDLEELKMLLALLRQQRYDH